mgnify:CR=1 FL=1|tara:strand:+ start:265 stop:756 length:492 start_codon:yes stop_codon:yes gene_type:complete
MDNKKKVSKTSQTISINHETGEIIESAETKTYVVDREPAYIKVYLDDIIRLNDLPKGMARILMEMVKTMGYNNVFVAYMPVKKHICEKLGIKIDYLNKCINTFHKKGLLIRKDRGVYIADPNLFAKGKWEEIKDLRLVIDYKKDGTKELKSNLPEQVQLKLGF